MITCFDSHVHVYPYIIEIFKLTCDVGQQDGEEDHRSKEGGDHDVQRIPAARGHLDVEQDVRIGKSEETGSEIG